MNDHQKFTVFRSVGLRSMKLPRHQHRLYRPTHRACETVEMLSRETSDFMLLLQWPSNSPDLKPVDYAIWGTLQVRVYWQANP